MKDILHSIRLQINERLSSPLIGAFVISWVCWNYRFLFVIFSDLPIHHRLDVIDNFLYRTNGDIWIYAILLPLASAITYILLSPYPTRWIYGYWLNEQNKLKNLRDKIEGQKLLTVEESRKIYAKMLGAEADFSARFQQFENDRLASKELISKLQENLANANRKIESLKKNAPESPAKPLFSLKSDSPPKTPEPPSIAEITQRIHDLGPDDAVPLTILAVLANSTRRVSFDHICAGVSQMPATVIHYIRELEKLKLVDSDTNSAGLTDFGREYLVKSGVR